MSLRVKAKSWFDLCSIFLTTKGQVLSFGWGADGQTGLGHYETRYLPSKVTGDVQGENIVKVATSADCVLALNGIIYFYRSSFGLK